MQTSTHATPASIRTLRKAGVRVIHQNGSRLDLSHDGLLGLRQRDGHYRGFLLGCGYVAVQIGEQRQPILTEQPVRV